MAKNKNAKHVIAGGNDGFAYRFNLNNGKLIHFKAHEGECMTVASLSGSDIVYTGGEDGLLKEVLLLQTFYFDIIYIYPSTFLTNIFLLYFDL